MSIRIGIYGYGNLGRGVVSAIKQNSDMTLSAIFTRRDPASLKINDPGVRVLRAEEAENMVGDIDVMILCGGSATDLPVQTPALSRLFNCVDSFDNHSRIPEHFAAVDKTASESGHLTLISCGWDPGMFSLNRLYASAVLPEGNDYTFWGKGISQGHSDAIRRIDGVLDARQYTIPVEDAINSVRRGENPVLSAGEKHTRECYVVAEDGADKARIEQEIKTMPAYFADYNTTVHFISAEELKANHSAMYHGGVVIRSGKTGNGNNHVIEYSLKLDSNPEFTSSVLVSCARAVHRMACEGMKGCKTMLDVAPVYLSPLPADQLRKKLL